MISPINKCKYIEVSKFAIFKIFIVILSTSIINIQNV